jgi:hypothetical protein
MLFTALLGTSVPSALAADPHPDTTLIDPRVENERGFIALFNGEDLKGWEGNPKFWSVRDGTITGQTTAENPTRGNTFLVWRDGEVSDFELRSPSRSLAEIPAFNTEARSWIKPTGWSAATGRFKRGRLIRNCLRGTRARHLAQRGQMVWIQPDGKKRVVGTMGKSEDIQAAIKKEEWNDYVVIARGNHITQSSMAASRRIWWMTRPTKRPSPESSLSNRMLVRR